MKFTALIAAVAAININKEDLPYNFFTLSDKPRFRSSVVLATASEISFLLHCRFSYPIRLDSVSFHLIICDSLPEFHCSALLSKPSFFLANTGYIANHNVRVTVNAEILGVIRLYKCT